MLSRHLIISPSIRHNSISTQLYPQYDAFRALFESSNLLGFCFGQSPLAMENLGVFLVSLPAYLVSFVPCTYVYVVFVLQW